MADGKTAEAARQQTIKNEIAKYTYFNAITETHPELHGFFDEVKKVIKASKTGTISQDEFNALTRKYTYFTDQDAAHQRADMQLALDKQNNTNLYGEDVASIKRGLQDQMTRYGFQVDDADLQKMAEDAKRGGWDPTQTKEALGSQLEKVAAAGTDLRGTAGDVQNELSVWAKANGLDLTAEQLAPFISRGATGAQSVDDAKSELRKTYLRGMYPAWGDYIDKGMDPSTIFAPYVQQAQKLLEMDSIGLDDPIMQRITQHVGADGKPAILPLYEANKLIRQDARWDKTDNAYSTYANVAQNVLKTFGFA